MMTRLLPLIVVTMTAVLGWPPAALTQPAQPAAAPTKTAITALMVEVVISRYEGDKRLSNMPFSLVVNTDNTRSSLRIGGEVPVPATTFQAIEPKEGKPAPPPPTSELYHYRPIGTNIDVNAVAADDGRYRVSLIVEDSSIYADLDKPQAGARIVNAPAFRSFRTTNSLTMRNGQTVEFTAAADRISGEVVKVSVKMTVLN